MDENKTGKSLLIIAQDAGGIPDGLKKGFESIGVRTILDLYSYPVHSKKRGVFDRIYHRIFDPGYQRTLCMEFNKHLENQLKSDRYHSILIMRGNYLTAFTKRLLIEFKAPKVTWLYDPIKTASLQKDVADLSMFVLCADKIDTEIYPNNSIWLPLGYDDSVYYPREVEKDIDVFISGSISRFYTRRKAVLEFLGSNWISKKYRCVFVGSTGFSLSDMAVRVGNIEWLSKRVEPQKLAELQSRARFCINIHRDDSKSCINPSSFSIPGCKSLMVAEKNKFLRSFLTPNEHYLEFDNIEELPALIEKTLRDEESIKRISEVGYRKVKEEHTLQKRAILINEILEKLRNEKREG